MPKGDPLSYAVDAEQNLEALATELASLGVDDATVQTVTQMATTVRKIIKVLGKGQAQTADNEPPAPEPEPKRSEGPFDKPTSDLQSGAQERAKERY